ncbi:META domain-containing protein [Henriciella marina]|uniref:META domain-containing protein n=1 Tax=Henriciella marina TaxID=453851 RepID=UPI000380AD1E|nr:META domain-containing protein [Henriciella marina]
MIKAFTALAGLAIVAACAQSPATGSQTGQMGAETDPVLETKVLGSLNYRPRIALPQDAVAHLSVRGAGSDEAELLAEQSFALNGRQVPIPFEIIVQQEAEDGALGLSADIRSGAGELLWQTDEARAFAANGTQTDLDMVMLAPAGKNLVTLEDLAGREWMIARLNGKPVLTSVPITLTFSETGQISGQASCNAYTASASVEDSMLSIGPVALTRKGCMPDVMVQEAFYLDLLEYVSLMQIDETGLLTMSADTGETLTAR